MDQNLQEGRHLWRDGCHRLPELLSDAGHDVAALGRDGPNQASHGIETKGLSVGKQGEVEHCTLVHVGSIDVGDVGGHAVTHEDAPNARPLSRPANCAHKRQMSPRSPAPPRTSRWLWPLSTSIGVARRWRPIDRRSVFTLNA